MPLLDVWIQQCQMLILASLFAQEFSIVHLLFSKSSVVPGEEQAEVLSLSAVGPLQQASKQQPWESIQQVL